MNKKVAKALARPEFYEFGIKIQAGRIIPVYWNPKAALSDPRVLRIVVQEFARKVKKITPKIEVVAGGESGGICLAAAVALELNLPWVYIRKRAKGYSTDLLIEGKYPKGARAILLDDVIATGRSKEIFLENASDNLTIADIGVILEDMSGNYPEWIIKRNIRLHVLVPKSERDEYFHQIGFFSDKIYELETAYARNRDHWQDNKDLWNKFMSLKSKNNFYG